MNVLELMEGRRTYRRFTQQPVPRQVIDDMVQAVRLSSCGRNRQAVRLIAVQSPEMVAQVNGLVKWAAALPPEQGTPKPGEQPTLFMAVVQDVTAPGELNTDTGIALANLTLAAWASGVGSCIMQNIHLPRLTALLGLGENEKLHSMVALGYPSHRVHLVPVENGDLNYYLDEARDYCVPKRAVDELVRYR